jgi:hypothetical protein
MLQTHPPSACAMRAVCDERVQLLLAFLHRVRSLPFTKDLIINQPRHCASPCLSASRHPAVQLPARHPNLLRFAWFALCRSVLSHSLSVREYLEDLDEWLQDTKDWLVHMLATSHPPPRPRPPHNTHTHTNFRVTNSHSHFLISLPIPAALSDVGR